MNNLIKSGRYFLYVTTKNLLFTRYKDTKNYDYYKDFLSVDEFSSCERIYQNLRQRKYKNKERILKWIFAIKNLKNYKNYKLVFGTLTFSDDELKLKKDTRRRYIQRFLNENTIEYIANIDYGKVNNREHYHFIAIIKDNINTKNWKSIINIKKINIDNPNQVINYVLKLNNHTFKESTKNERLIIDRNKYLEKIIDTMYKEEYRKFKLKIN